MKNETKNCQNCKKDFVIEPDDFGFYEKIKVPPPTWCPECRFILKALWRNETSLYNRTCAKTDKPIISMYNSKSPYAVVSHDFYESDEWNPKEYGMDFNSNESFFDQLKKLFVKVPKVATFISTGDGPNINSIYSNYAGGLKNCYFVFNSGPAEETLYSRGCRNIIDSMDNYFSTKVEKIYECVDCHKSSNIYYGKNVSESVNCLFVTNIRNCMNCLGCVNLRNASYQIFNKQVTKEEYEKTIKDILGSYKKIEQIKKKFKEFEKKFPVRSSHNLKTSGSTGDYLTECKNVKDSFEVVRGEDSRYLFSSKELKDSYGTIGYGFNSDRLLECVGVGYSSNIIGGVNSSNCHDVMYSCFLRNCHDCIGCDSLRNAKYCILNKQYTKEEYEKTRELIFKELLEKNLHGLIMPAELAPFAYNETIAQDNFPITKEKAIAIKVRWEDDIQKTKNKETKKPEDTPDQIKDVENSITDEILQCIDCSRNYKITEQELLFYRRMNIPIPRRCFYCRHKDRIARRGPYKFWNRSCAKCKKKITTNYDPGRPEIVYCEKCYQQEVY